MEILFYVHASAAVLAMVMAMLTYHAVHALLYAVFSLICLAISMYAQSAPLAAALEVIIYAGAIMVLFVFAVMLLQVPHKNLLKDSRKNGFLLGVFFVVVLLLDIGVALFDGFLPKVFAEQSIQDIAYAFLSRHGMLIEIISLIMLGSLITAVVIGQNLIRRDTKARSG
jgi:NADH-quinone oxidoreductase subunit J